MEKYAASTTESGISPKNEGLNFHQLETHEK